MGASPRFAEQSMEIQDISQYSETLLFAPPVGRLHASAARHWFALNVRTRHEKMVGQALAMKDFETFLPLYTKRHQYVRRVRDYQLPLFPGYLFCRFDPTACLPIVTTPGVMKIVGAGHLPIPVNTEEIESIQKAVEARIPMFPHAYLHAGQRGRINSGALAGVEGVVVSDKNTFRLLLSISLLQRSVLLEIDAGRVDFAAEPHAHSRG